MIGANMINVWRRDRGQMDKCKTQHFQATYGYHVIIELDRGGLASLKAGGIK